MREAGLDLVKFSLDSPDAEEHNRLRGLKGLYEHNFRPAARDPRDSRIARALLRDGDARAGGDGRAGEVRGACERRGRDDRVCDPDSGGALGSEPRHSLEPHHFDVILRLARDPAVFLPAFSSNERVDDTRELYVTCHGDVLPNPYIQISFGNIHDEPLAQIYRRIYGWRAFNEGTPPALVLENETFVERYIAPLTSYQPLPLTYTRHPNIDPAAHLPF
ncbi:MAG: hypothetical protein M5R36_24675 [Deltaproteobacteria bacterium]|nr:hypothetical protein [Deltaproteobacteria bacterium]